MSQSVFHVNHPESILKPDVQSCCEAITSFNIFSHQYDGAGSRLVQSFTKAMLGTPYQSIAEECAKGFHEVFMARQTLKCFEQFKTMESELYNLNGQIDAGNQNDSPKMYAQTFFNILLQFVKMQEDYFKVCQETISRLVIKINPQNNDRNPSVSENATKASNNSSKGTKPQSPKHQHQGILRSTFFSLFDKKPVLREKQSAFYVEMKDGDLENTPPTPQISCNDIPNSSLSTTTKTPVDLASEEEIDSVINLLSGVSCQSSKTMHAIPENGIQLTVPQTYRLPSPASDTHIDELKLPHLTLHRRSEGSIDLSSMQKNIWNISHRGSLSGVGMHQANEGDLGAINKRYSQEMQSVFRNTAPYLSIQHNAVWPDSQWLGTGTTNTWPYYNTTHSHGSEIMNSSWSGVHDSSDLSDDSSCGEQFFAVGQDLVQALDSKDQSSEDESRTKGERSLENKKKSSNTWPPPQHWDGGGSDRHGDMLHLLPDEQQATHRPVQMQWSDPMSTHSRWPSNPPAVHQHRHSQSMQGFGLYQ